MAYNAPLQEQQFVLEQVAGIAETACSGSFGSATNDMVGAVLDGAAAFASGAWGRLAEIGDTVGARLGAQGVVMPDGYVAAYRDYIEGGWGTLVAQERFGGQGLPFSLQTAVLETLGGANMAFALCPLLTAGAVEALQHHGSAEQQQRYLRRLVSGEWTGTMNLTEPQAGSDVGALRTMATPASDGTWSIKGTKIFISYGDHDLAGNIVHLVLARTPDAPPGTRGISLFLVPKFRLDASGEPGEFNDVRVVSIEHKLGMHASPTCVLSFGDEGGCFGELIGPEYGGMRAMFTMMNNARLNVGLQGVQVAEAATQAAVAYALDRTQSARTGAAHRAPVKIIEHPDVRRMLMRMRAQTQAARALVYYAAGQVDRLTIGQIGARDRLDLLTPLAKAHATDLGCEVASLGIQVHGGMGYIEDTGAARFLRDARITPIYEGTNGIQAADLVGRKLDLDGGNAFASLIADMRAEAQDAGLQALIEGCESTGLRLSTAHADDRLAASTPFLTMLSVATCGWLLERQSRAATGDEDFATMKRAVANFYLRQIVPEASGLLEAARQPASDLYALTAEGLAA